MSSESPLTARPENLAQPLAWLPARARGALPDDAVLRDWLRDPGSLTSRLRAACGAGFRLELLGEATESLPADARGLLDGTTVRARRVRMFCGDALCVCATTLIPLPTLAGTDWLASLGDRPLGDALLARDGIRRSAFEFARVSPSHPLFLPALQDSDIRPAAIWSRRSRFSLAAGPLLVYEMFLPGLTRCGTP
ncbi:chorismate lyase [Thioalkalivibrio sp. XN8]|uniref:chorismate--pyruvate lyase family protein n=1 Tax=Thioalkalivibrio sp. XN8 TaxID=2712863 RepID=UPI0013EC1E08|nr:chorismate lyase [Thioalkalivibrio sp. XN8]NGP52379.1 chorismate lyase [Thioalkalivibrio sp. XN8]